MKFLVLSLLFSGHAFSMPDLALVRDFRCENFQLKVLVSTPSENYELIHGSESATAFYPYGYRSSAVTCEQKRDQLSSQFGTGKYRVPVITREMAFLESSSTRPGRPFGPGCSKCDGGDTVDHYVRGIFMKIHLREHVFGNVTRYQNF